VIKLVKRVKNDELINLVYQSYQCMCKQHGLFELGSLTTMKVIKTKIIIEDAETWGIYYPSNSIAGMVTIQANSVARLFIHPDKLNLGLGNELLNFTKQRIKLRG